VASQTVTGWKLVIDFIKCNCLPLKNQVLCNLRCWWSGLVQKRNGFNTRIKWFDATDEKNELSIQRCAVEYARMKSSVFNLRLITGSNVNDDSKTGKVFQHVVTNRRVLRSKNDECRHICWSKLRLRICVGHIVELAGGAIPCWHVDSRKWALPSCALFFPKPIANEDSRVTELRGCTSKPSRLVAQRRIAHTKVDRATCWDEQQGLWRSYAAYHCLVQINVCLCLVVAWFILRPCEYDNGYLNSRTHSTPTNGPRFTASRHNLSVRATELALVATASFSCCKLINLTLIILD